MAERRKMKGELEEYDLRKLEAAKQTLIEIHGYYYSAPRMSKKVKRLETIIKKIEELQKND